MNDEILKLAKECDMIPDKDLPGLYLAEEQNLEAFYRVIDERAYMRGFNAGLEAAANVCDETHKNADTDGWAKYLRDTIRALEM